MKLLVDTNVAFDFLDHRDPFYKSAELLMLLTRAHEVDCWISPSQFGDLAYLLTDGGKKSSIETAKANLKRLRQYVHVCSIGEPEVDRAFESDWDDLEDAMVYQAARSIRADAIITRNQKDFSRSRIPVFDCDELFAWLRDEKGIDYDYIQI